MNLPNRRMVNLMSEMTLYVCPDCCHVPFFIESKTLQAFCRKCDKYVTTIEVDAGTRKPLTQSSKEKDRHGL